MVVHDTSLDKPSKNPSPPDPVSASPTCKPPLVQQKHQNHGKLKDIRESTATRYSNQRQGTAIEHILQRMDDKLPNFPWTPLGALSPEMGSHCRCCHWSLLATDSQRDSDDMMIQMNQVYAILMNLQMI